MKSYNGILTLNRNSRGCYILDTVKGCGVCQDEKPMGCYDNCYAKRIADRYAFDFGHTVVRKFVIDEEQGYLLDVRDQHHIGELVKQIENASMPFIRIGDMGDPSYDWNHTVDVCEKVAIAGKPIVIITKHWKTIPDDLLDRLSALDVCINTSVSALDDNYDIYKRRLQYERLKGYCRSVLRVVTCDFNIECREGLENEIMQEYLLCIGNVIETVFRPDKGNRLIQEGIINVTQVQFLGTKCLASMRNNDIYLGYCDTCPDMCGLANKYKEEE
jgi:hypothetical protein